VPGVLGFVSGVTDVTVLIVDHTFEGWKAKMASETVSWRILNGIFTQEVNGCGAL
jgi:hypothetical protein